MVSACAARPARIGPVRPKACGEVAESEEREPDLGTVPSQTPSVQ
jgi:hypothetical protein